MITEPAPAPKEPQRLRALEHANAVRLARAELKRRIAEGEVSAAEVILECPPAARKWTLGELLMAQRRWGSTRCRKFLEHNGVSELKPIGALTDRQRRVLADQLGTGSRTGTGQRKPAGHPAVRRAPARGGTDPEPAPTAEADRELVLV